MALRLVSAAAVASTVVVAYDCTFASSYPRQYVAYQVAPNTPIVLDGKLDEPAWTEVPFTESFVDISTTTLPRYTTKSKIRWDEQFLYVGFYIQDSQIWHNISSVCHCVNASQDQVIYHDNDIETFVDPDGSTHYYKEVRPSLREVPF